MIVWVFPIIAICGVAIAYWLKFYLSGERLNSITFFSFMIFNGFFVVPYMDILYYDNFLFLGHRPDILYDFPAIGWAALLCVILHCFALPTKEKNRCWFSRK